MKLLKMQLIKINQTILLITMLFLLCNGAAAKQFGKVQQALQKIKTLKGSFVQTNYYKQLDETYEFKGDFILKRPDRLKWRYRQGSSDVVYIMGTKAVIIQPEQKQAIIEDTKNLGFVKAPVFFIFDKRLLDKDFKVVKHNKSEVVLVPLNKSIALKKIILKFNGTGKFPLKAINIEDLYGNIIKIRFLSVQIDIPVREKDFIFKIPQDYTVLDSFSG